MASSFSSTRRHLKRVGSKRVPKKGSASASTPKAVVPTVFATQHHSILKFADAVVKSGHLLEKKVESKVAPKDAPQSLVSGPVLALIHTPESTLLAETFGSLWGDGKQYQFRLSTNLAMSSSGAGSVNSVIGNNTLGTVTQFVALAGVFSEYFIKGFHCAWEPVSMYNGPIGYVPATTVSSVPLVVTGLQHGQAAYTTPGAMANSSDVAFHNTGRPFTYAWKNVEDPRTNTLYGTESGVAAGYQGWQQTSAVSNYSGQVQFLAAANGLPLPASTTLGTFVVHWDVLFRIRL